MKVPQILIIVFFTMGLTIHLIKHGEERGKYNVWTYLLSAVIEIGILIWGGFFN